MFEFEEAGGLHDVFLNKHAVSSHQNIFPKFERQMFNKKNSKMEEFSSSFTNTCIAGNAIVMMIFFSFVRCRAEELNLQSLRLNWTLIKDIAFINLRGLICRWSGRDISLHSPLDPPKQRNFSHVNIFRVLISSAFSSTTQYVSHCVELILRHQSRAHRSVTQWSPCTCCHYAMQWAL